MRVSSQCAASLFGLAAALLLPVTAQAQSIGYDPVGGTGGSDAGSYQPSSDSGGGTASRKRRTEVTPYIEIAQVVNAQLSPGNDVLTYTQVAAGVDATISGRNTGAAVSARYARQIGWGDTRDADIISGIAHGYATVTPGLTVTAGGLATQTSYSGGSGTSGRGDDGYRLYSVYAGPALKTRVGDVDVAASYRAGYSRLEDKNGYQASVDSAPVDFVSESVVQSADVQAGVAPGVVLPVGLAVGGSFYQEDITDLDQRVRDMQARAMVTVPVNRTTQVVGAIGYEDVEISNRDAVYDEDGNPVIGTDGHYVVDKSVPRQLSYDVSGIIWDVGVMWRPSQRTALSAHVGRRYGSTSFGGTLAYAPDDRKHLSIAVYDNVAGFGGQVNRALYDLPDDFEAVRDPVTGELNGCVNSLEGNNCLSGVLGSVRTSAFRARGVAASYTMQLGRINAGIGLGYDRRKYIAAEDTILASVNGTVDENYWLSAFLSGRLGSRASWSTNAHANWTSSNYSTLGDSAVYGISAAYYRSITPRLSGTLAVSVDGTTYNDTDIDDIWYASGLAALRYSF